MKRKLLGLGFSLFIIVLIETALRIFFPSLEKEAEKLLVEAAKEENRKVSVVKEADTDLLWRLKAGAQLFENERLNRHGFRGPGFTVKKPPGCYRVVCLGDSRTFGFGVSDYSHTFCGRITRTIRNQNMDARLEIINLGVLGYSSFQGKRLMDKFGWSLDPDLVVAWFGYNDVMFFHLMDKEAAERGKLIRKMESWLNRLRLFQFMRKTGELMRRRSNEPIQVGQRIVRRVTPEDYAANLRELAVEAERRNSRLTLMNTPVRPGIPMIMNPKLIRFENDKGRLCERLELQYDLEGFWLMDATEFPGPEAKLDELMQRYPEFPILHYFKYKFLKKNGDYDAARRELLLSRELDTERRVISEYNDRLLSVAQDRQIPVIDLVSTFDEIADASLFVDESHPNKAGHALIADQIINLLTGGE